VSRHEKRAICKHCRSAADAEPTQREDGRLDRLLEVPVTSATRLARCESMSLIAYESDEPSPRKTVSTRLRSGGPRGRTRVHFARRCYRLARPACFAAMAPASTSSAA
jgi:hypothetical protein